MILIKLSNFSSLRNDLNEACVRSFEHPEKWIVRKYKILKSYGVFPTGCLSGSFYNSGDTDGVGFACFRIRRYASHQARKCWTFRLMAQVCSLPFPHLLDGHSFLQVGQFFFVFRRLCVMHKLQNRCRHFTAVM